MFNRLVLRFNKALNASAMLTPMKSEGPSSAAEPSPIHAIGNPRTSRARLHSLDSFRGFALTIMIFVNYGGGDYYFFNHSVWNGLTVADLVFPWFIWVMGVSMALAFNALLKRNTSRLNMTYKIVRRAAILFALGLLLCNLHNLTNGRVPNVLQRFAVSYLVVGLIIIYVPKRADWWVGGNSATDIVSNPPPLVNVSDEKKWWLSLWGLVYFLIYRLFLFFSPVTNRVSEPSNYMRVFLCHAVEPCWLLYPTWLLIFMNGLLL